MTAGTYHTCALMTSGEVRCWGLNDAGQVGVPGAGRYTAPVSVATNVRQVEASNFSTCAVSTSGALHCWGTNTLGQLGDGSTDTRSSPTLVALAPVEEIALGGGQSNSSTHVGTHGCARLSAGPVVCWGANQFGQLGRGNNSAGTFSGFVERAAPPRSLGPVVVKTAIGHQAGCAAVNDGGVVCWGANENGNVGDGTHYPRGSPVTIVGLPPVTDLATSSEGDWSPISGHTCAVASGSLYCWGANESGQLGLGTATTEPVRRPQRVLASNVRAVSTGSFHTCAVGVDDSLRCWGRNSDGQLGDGTSTRRVLPTVIEPSGVSAVSAASTTTCAVMHSGALRCWGYASNWRFPTDGGTTSTVPVELIDGGVAKVVSSTNHSCLLTKGGGYGCWGYNGNGQLLDGTTTSRPVPTVIVNSGYRDIAVTSDRSCLVSTAGAVTCVGADLFGGQPVGIAAGTDSLTLGDRYGCMHTMSGDTLCWGRPTEGVGHRFRTPLVPMPMHFR